MERNRQIISFNKITPMAIRLPTAGIEFPVLDLLPNGDDLLGIRRNILRTDHDLYLPKLLPLVRLDKVEFGGNHLPILLLIAIDQDLIEDRLPPVVAPIRISGTRRR